MSATYKSTQRWRYKARQWITKYAGGQCQCCGYNIYIGNLAFHHVHSKKDSVCYLINKTASWDRIIEEADKCVLVCHNCHGEIHAALRVCPEINYEQRKTTLITILTEKPVQKTQTHSCICGKQIRQNRKYCSQQCHHNASQCVKWPQNLPELVQQSSKSAIATLLGVSDKAVAKRLKNHHQEPATGVEPAME